MVGEIRDKETAELAVQAALTGHLVFQHAAHNSAAGILPRLFRQRASSHSLIASTVHTVIGQRLLRRVGKQKGKHIGLMLQKRQQFKPRYITYCPKRQKKLPRFLKIWVMQACLL